MVERAFAAWRSRAPVAEYTMKSESINRSTNCGLSDSSAGRISNLSVLMMPADSTGLGTTLPIEASDGPQKGAPLSPVSSRARRGNGRRNRKSRWG